MTPEILLLLIIISIALILFSLEQIPVDVVALGTLLVITLAGLLPPERAFAGFGSDPALLVLGLLILTAALTRTGVVDSIGRVLVRWTGTNQTRLFLSVTISAAILSAFISNTAATALFIPIVIGVARKAKMSTVKLLLPLAFASILSSSVTLVATSTNIVVSGLMIQHGMSPISMFELTPVGLPIAVVGLMYMFFIGRRIIPERKANEYEFEEIGTLPYLSEVVILPGSPLAKKTLAESRLGRDLDLTVLRVDRDPEHFLAPQANFLLEEGDELLIEGQRNELIKVNALAGIDFIESIKVTDPSLQSDEVQLVEAIILLRSPLIGRTLQKAKFRERYGLQVLAVNRHGETIRHKINQLIFQLGDVLLIQGNRSNITALEADKSFRILGSVEEKITNVKKAPIAIIAYLGALFLATINIVSLPVAVLLAVCIVFVTGCITPEEAYREVEWKMVILIGCMLGVGAALEYTGAAKYLASQIVFWLGDQNPVWLLATFFLLTMLLTQPMSNQAAAAVVVPIAIQTAVQLGVNPRTFAMMIAVGASCSYLTPLEPSCLMVYGPGRYRFVDFLKVGAILTVIIFLIAVTFVPIIWPL